MSDMSTSSPTPKPHPPASPAAIPAKPRPPSNITKPLPPPVVTATSKEKQKIQRPRQRLSPPALPPPAPPTISPSPPPYSSISPPPSPLLHSALVPISSTRQHTPPSRPPPPSIPAPSAPPCIVTSESPLCDHLLPSAPPLTDDEGVTVQSGGGGEGGKEGEQGDAEEEEEAHSERAPVSQGATAVLQLRENVSNTPEYVNVDSLDEEEEDDEDGDKESEEEEAVQREEMEQERSPRYSVIRQDYQNWDFLENSGSENSDSGDGKNATPRPSNYRHSSARSNPPTLPLNTHPVLMAQLGRGPKPKGRKRRNRAPPPPPGVDRNREGKMAAGKLKVGEKDEKGDKRVGKRKEKEDCEEERSRGSEEDTLRGAEEERERDHSTVSRINYINWEFEQDDGSLSDENSAVPTPQPKARRPNNPPTHPLSTRPILLHSKSHGNVSESPDDNVGDGRWPRNRAPPPPPSKTKSKPPGGFAHQLSHQPLSTPTPYPDSEPSASKGGSEYALVTKLPVAHKRTKSDQKPVYSDSEVTSSPAKERDGPPSRPPPRPQAAPTAGIAKKKKRFSAVELESEGRGKEREPFLQQPNINVKRKESSGAAEHLSRPKRQAPPPPPPGGRQTSVDQSEGQRDQESPQALSEKHTKVENRLQTPPPKPKRLHRRTPPIVTDAVTMATEGSPTAQERTDMEERQSSSSETPRAENGQGLDRWERLLHKMEFFTLNLIKDGDRSLGMVIVSGKVRNKDGTTVEGIFIQKILPGSLTDKDGRIQAGDMLVEINSTSMVGATVELASKKLRESKESVKLKVGRPDRGAFKVPGEDTMEPIYVNSDDVEDSDLQARLDKAETRAEKVDELRDKAVRDLKLFKEKADEEQKELQRKLEEAKEENDSFRKDTQAKINDLTIALANISVDKTKLEKEVEALRLEQTQSTTSQESSENDEIVRIKRELKEAESERDMAERHLRELRQEMEGNSDLQVKLTELKAHLSGVEQEREAVKRQLESTCHELTVAHATLEQMQIEKTAMTEENERLLRELETVRRPSTGRAGAQAEISLMRKELAAAKAEAQAAREEREKVQEEVESMRMEVERKKKSIGDLENKLESQQRTEKIEKAALQSEIDSQAQEIQNLRKEISEMKEQGLQVETTVITVKETKRKEEREHSDKESNKRPGGLAAGKKQRSLDIEYSPVHTRAQSPPNPRSLASSAGKETTDTRSSPAKDGSPKSPRNVPHEDSISIEAFDTIKPLEMLDNTHAKNKTQVALRNAKRARNKPSREHIRSMSAENLLSEVETSTPDDSSSPTEKLPVPRPRKATLEKESPSHKPLPIPRHHSPATQQTDHTPPQRPPKPETSPGSPDRKTRFGGRVSPPHTRAPSPKPLLPPLAKNGLPPKPVPRRPMKREESPMVDDTQTKDPSQLTVKERMELAHKATKKPPPIIPKKPPSSRVAVDFGGTGPKSLSQPEDCGGDDLPGTRYSVDSAHSPRPMRKLPPGAFNIGLVPMAPFGPNRHRSNTTASVSREQSQDREIAEESAPKDETDAGSKEALDVDDIEVKLPPKRPPLPLNKQSGPPLPLTKRSASNEKPSEHKEAIQKEPAPPQKSMATSDIDAAEAKPEEEVEVHMEHGTIPDPSTLDYSQVLAWTPVQVAAWVTHIGAGQYSKCFLDKGVQGIKLFDIDSSGLKAMGINLADDRALIKKEIKALDKQRKVLEKQRRDDKKKKKRQFV